MKIPLKRFESIGSKSINNYSLFKKAAAKLSKLTIVRVFFNSENPREVGDKAWKVAGSNIFYRFIEWLLVGITFSLVCLLKHYQVSEFNIFLILWVWTIIDTSPGVLLNDWLKVDITAREGQRRWLDALYAQAGRFTFVLLILFEIGYCTYEIIWSGPEWFFLFFRSRISHWPRWGKVALYIVVAGIQMAVWTKIYCLGYESVSELIKHYWK